MTPCSNFEVRRTGASFENGTLQANVQLSDVESGTFTDYLGDVTEFRRHKKPLQLMALPVLNGEGGILLVLTPYGVRGGVSVASVAAATSSVSLAYALLLPIVLFAAMFTAPGVLRFRVSCFRECAVSGAALLLLCLNFE